MRIWLVNDLFSKINFLLLEVIDSLLGLLNRDSISTIDVPVSWDINVLFRSNTVVLPLSVVTNIIVVNVVSVGTESLLVVLSRSFRSDTTVLDNNTRSSNRGVFTLDLGVFTTESLTFSEGFNKFKNSLGFIPFVFINGGVTIEDISGDLVTSVDLVISHRRSRLESFTSLSLSIDGQKDRVFNVFSVTGSFSLILVVNSFTGGGLIIDFTSLVTSQGHGVGDSRLPLTAGVLRTRDLASIFNSISRVRENESTIFSSSSVDFR